MNFNNENSTISCDPPQTAGVLGILLCLYYQLVLINTNTDQVIVNTTYQLLYLIIPFDPLCQVYVGTVTAHVGNMAGETVVQEQRTQ